MADGRDIALMNSATATMLDNEHEHSGIAGAFANPKIHVFTGTTSNKQVLIELGPAGFQWSKPTTGGIFRIRPVTRIFIGVKSVRDVAFCGYDSTRHDLVTMDDDENLLQRYRLGEAQLHHKHP